MTGKIVIEQGPLPDGIPEGAEVIAFRILGDAELSAIERIVVLYQLATALGYGTKDWDELAAMVRREPPYNEITEAEYQIGVSGWVGDEAPVLHGEWYGEADGYADGELVFDIWSCPICGKRFDEWEEKPDWNFCPNCGARMDGES